MAEKFDELLDLSDANGSSPIAKFIHRGDDINSYAKTWEYFAYSYSQAFDELARSAFERRGNNLGNALFFLARHSIELGLKCALLEFSETDSLAPKLEGHDLKSLWTQLCGYMERWGVPANDVWGFQIEKHIFDIQEADPRGDRFRYPSDLKGKPFELTRVELEGLVRAHNSITTYCDACASMHSEGYRG